MIKTLIKTNKSTFKNYSRIIINKTSKINYDDITRKQIVDMRKNINDLFDKIDNRKQLDEQENKLYENIFKKEIYSFDNYLYDKVKNDYNKNEKIYIKVITYYLCISIIIFVGYVTIGTLYVLIWDEDLKIRNVIKEGLNIAFFAPVTLLSYIYKKW